MADSEQSPNSGFLGRWSRRKQSESETTVVEETTAQPLVVEDDANIATVAESAEVSVDEVSTDEEKQLTDDDMVPLESLDADSDYSPFFSEGVSKQLRNMALKKLFFSGKFAIRDGLDDYDDDFTKFEPLGDTITSDMKFHQRRKEKARLAKLEEERLKEEARLQEEEAQNKIAGQQHDEETQQDEEIQQAVGGEDAPDSIAQTVEADQNQSVAVTPNDAKAQDQPDQVANLAISALHGGVTVDNDNIDLTSPHTKLTKIKQTPAQKTAVAAPGQAPDETKRDQS